MPPSSVSSFDDWDLDSHLPVFEEAAETVLCGHEEEAAEHVAARLPSPPGRPKTFGPEPSQQSALAAPALSSVPSHPKTAGCAMVRGDGRIHCRYCEHERHSPVLCLVCQERLNGPADYMKHLKTIQPQESGSSSEVIAFGQPWTAAKHYAFRQAFRGYVRRKS
jgi:hypothetical protein